MPEILPFTSYFTPETLTQAKMRGEQLRGMQTQRRGQEAKQQAISDIYGSPEEAARQDIMGQQQAQKMKRIQAAGGLLDSLSGAIKSSGYDPEVIKNIKARQDIIDAVSPLVDLQTYNWSPDGDDFVYGGEEPLPATIDGKEGFIQPGQAVTELPDGTYKSRAITAKETAAKAKGQPKPADYNKISQRITTLEGMKAKAKGGDASVIGALYASMGVEIPKGEEKDTKALIARIEHEQKILRDQLPKGYLQTETPEAAVVETEDAVGAFLEEYGTVQ